MAWKRIDFPIFDKLVGSGQTYALPTTSWPTWARGEAHFRRILIHCPEAGKPLASTRTTAGVIGRLLTERYDPKDLPKPFNYNFYLLTQTTGGQVFQSEPIPTTDPLHHSESASTWFNSYEPPPVR